MLINKTIYNKILDNIKVSPITIITGLRQVGKLTICKELVKDLNLKNMMINNNYFGSPLEACDYAMSFLGENGACRINGGGFAGSIVCLVPKSKLSIFMPRMIDKYGKSNVKKVSIKQDVNIVIE